MAKVKATDFEKAISAVLEDFKSATAKVVSEAAEDTALRAVVELKQTSPINQQTGQKRKPGKYARGWRVREEKRTTIPGYVVHNATDYQLTHLLEYGHALKKGGRTYGYAKAYPHIAKAEQNAVRNFEEAIRKGMQ